MTNQVKISVVVPVYNNEKYLPKCIESIINQTYKNLEIFLVDDGSPDNCGAICDEYAKKDSRITVIHKKNEGVVIARNCGIERANGDYITFVDSDDWIEPNMYEEMLRQGEGCDFISTGMYSNYREEYNASEGIDPIKEGLYRKNENLDIVLESFFLSKGAKTGFLATMCTRLFKAPLLKKLYKLLPNNLKFDDDRLFSYAFTLHCETVFIIHKSFYHYRMNDNSTMHSITKHYLDALEIFYWSMKSFFEKHPLKDILINKLERYVNFRLLYTTNRMMGFALENQIAAHILPFGKEELAGLNIVLYGAGRVGKNYYQQLTRLKAYNSLLWVDKSAIHYKQKYGYNIEQVSALQNACYDIIIIAVKNEQTALSIKNELVANGVDEAKIHWQAPIELFDIIYP